MKREQPQSKTFAEIAALRRGENLYFKPQKEVTSRLWLRHQEIASMNNLFSSYVQREAKPDRNKAFNWLLKRYIKSTADYACTLQIAVIDTLGEAAYSLLTDPANGYGYFYEPGFEAVCITKRCPLPCMRKA